LERKKVWAFIITKLNELQVPVDDRAPDGVALDEFAALLLDLIWGGDVDVRQQVIQEL
jgi:hypothetical protein